MKERKKEKKKVKEIDALRFVGRQRTDGERQKTSSAEFAEQRVLISIELSNVFMWQLLALAKLVARVHLSAL